MARKNYAALAKEIFEEVVPAHKGCSGTWKCYGFVMSPQYKLTIELGGKLRQKLVKKYQCVTKPEVLPPLFAPTLKETSPKQNETLRWSELW